MGVFCSLSRTVDFLTVVYTVVTMNTKTVINIKADKEVKEQAQYIAERLGVPLSSVINSFLKQFIRIEEVTFSTSVKMTPALESILVEIEKDRKKHRNVSKPFTVGETEKGIVAKTIPVTICEQGLL